MAGEGRPSTTLLLKHGEFVGGRAKPGHEVIFASAVVLIVLSRRFGLTLITAQSAAPRPSVQG